MTDIDADNLLRAEIILMGDTATDEQLEKPASEYVDALIIRGEGIAALYRLSTKWGVSSGRLTSAALSWYIKNRHLIKL